jgi:hypothetical protein
MSVYVVLTCDWCDRGLPLDVYDAAQARTEAEERYGWERYRVGKSERDRCAHCVAVTTREAVAV